MTTFDPGASVVLTHGLRFSPRSTAFLASSAAATMTDGFEVFVQDVIAAIATAPWSSSQLVPSAIATRVGRDVRPTALPTADAGAGSASAAGEAGSDAGNVSSTDSSTEFCTEET